jgi:hypothetical protein
MILEMLFGLVVASLGAETQPMATLPDPGIHTPVPRPLPYLTVRKGAFIANFSVEEYASRFPI